MQVVAARLRCGCQGDERLDSPFVGVRFITHEPCPLHQEWQWGWRDLSSTDLAWRDEKQVAQFVKDNALVAQWQGQWDAAIAAGAEPVSFRDFFARHFAEHPELDEDDEDED